MRSIQLHQVIGLQKIIYGKNLMYWYQSPLLQSSKFSLGKLMLHKNMASNMADGI